MRQVPKTSRIAVLLSGGVDSSVALALLKDAGYTNLTAFYLKIWLEDELAFLGECPWEEDLKFARAVCDQLGVPLEVVALQSEYWDRVVSYTIAELKTGRTPSPDIFCNQRVKFGAFWERLGTQFDYIASGHYAGLVEKEDDRVALLKGADPVKDQTYFLSHMSQVQLQRTLFPIGHLPKSEVRQAAERFDLPTQARPDSQGICFLGKIKYNDFVKFHLGEKVGEIRERGTEKVLGEHLGFWFHTLGQRKGLGLSGGPWFVVEKDLEKNIVYVAHENLGMDLATDTCTITNLNWLSDPPKLATPYTVKVRHGAHLYGCHLTPAETPDHLIVTLDDYDRGMAPGQFCVLYDGLECLGGGVIAN